MKGLIIKKIGEKEEKGDFGFLCVCALNFNAPQTFTIEN
jgi:hypothetical protein